MKKEVQKILDACFIFPVTYTKWVSNIVPVMKKNGFVRICVNFCDLNKSCPKDHHPTPFIDDILDSMAMHELLSLMDGFFGYNQILIVESNHLKIAFTTLWGTFTYHVIPFGLLNASATYQKSMMRDFHDILHCYVNSYFDDLSVKSQKRQDHFEILHLIFYRC